MRSRLDTKARVTSREFVGDRERPIARAIVHHEAFPVGFGLPNQASQTHGKRRFRIPDGQQDRDSRTPLKPFHLASIETRVFALNCRSSASKGLFFRFEIPMDPAVEASRFTFGVCSVPRASEIIGVFSRRDAASIGAVVIATLAAFLLVVPKASAQSEDQIMAAFLFNFARYVEWPEDAFDRSDMPVNICMLSSKEFGDVVSKTVLGKTIADRPVVARWTAELPETVGCHILFIGREFDRPHEDAVAVLDGMSVFTVADQEGFAQAGGTANFFRVGNRIRFEINPHAATKAGLKISSRLLRLAKVVE
jgi:hypothetical protein